MGDTSEGCFDSSYDYRNIRIYLLKNLSIDRDCIIRSLAGLSFRSIRVITSQTLGGSIMIHHRIHRTAVDTEIKSRSTELPEISKIIPPVRLRHDCHSISMFLEPPRNDSRTEGRMVDEGIACKEDDIDVIPSQRLDLLDRGRYHICNCFCHIVQIVQI